MLISQFLFFSTVIVVSELEGRISCSVVELGVGDLSSALFLHHWCNLLISFVNCIPYHAICNISNIIFILISDIPFCEAPELFLLIANMRFEKINLALKGFLINLYKKKKNRHCICSPLMFSLWKWLLFERPIQNLQLYLTTFC